ncbi:CLUMA_CG011093, isoform A [Clunio marinus]|uniref:CLUMA_CG011093, isoform A n=1 Tax=Clunio marinus TaxID=568069 RepID=A0A1J1ID92_9DIPT|nr:CLUMA_CG011093, isoform A [Clunio marinus]
MNTSTRLTLNDRFSMIKQGNGVLPKQQRGRSRSRSQTRRPSRQLSQGGPRKNRQLLDQLEKQHKMRMAMKLKNKSIMRSRGRVQSQNRRRPANSLIATIKRKMVEDSLKRGSNLTTFVPLNDGPRRNFRGRSRSRSQSRNRNQQRSQSRNRNQQQQQGSVIDRLGVRQPLKRMRRGPSNGGGQQQRSRSRVRLNRNNFNNNNVNNNNVNNRNVNNRNVNNRNVNNQGSVRRSNLLKSDLNDGFALLNQLRRFALNLPKNRSNQLNRPLRGRIVKRNQNRQTGNGAGVGGGRIARNIRQNPNMADGNRQRGKIIKRSAQAQTRGRAVNRKQANQRNGQGQAGRRGRSRTRRGVSNNNNNSRGIIQNLKQGHKVVEVS